MALRLRIDGRVLCAAEHPPEPGDLYLDDALHYRLAVEMGVLTTLNGGLEWHFTAKPNPFQAAELEKSISNIQQAHTQQDHQASRRIACLQRRVETLSKRLGNGARRK